MRRSAFGHRNRLANSANSGPGSTGPAPSLITSANSITSTTNSVSIGFTAAAGSVVVIAAGCETATASFSSITGVSGLGLTWALRSKSTCTTGVVGQQSEIWYAVNSGGSASGTIILSYASTFDDQALIVSSWSGCNLASPWDTSVVAYGGSTTNPTISLTTTKKYTTGIAFWGTPNQNDAGTWTGWTNIAQPKNSAANWFQYANLSYKQFSSIQSNVTVTTPSAANQWTAHGDALVAAT